jgi:hypothetical protein
MRTREGAILFFIGCEDGGNRWANVLKSTGLTPWIMVKKG